jgi:hypothetical protein
VRTEELVWRAGERRTKEDARLASGVLETGSLATPSDLLGNWRSGSSGRSDFTARSRARRSRSA